MVEASMSAVRRGGKVSFVGVYLYNYDNFKVGQILNKGLRIQARQSTVHAIIDELLEYVKMEN
ncbi:hypothetical protein ACK1KB_12630 [Chryseobacterium sp. TY3]